MSQRGRLVRPAKPKSARIAAELSDDFRSASDERLSHKKHCVYLIAEGWSYSQVSTIFHHGPATLKRWYQKYNKYGPTALRDKARSGRPPKLSPEILSAVRAALKLPPSAVGLRPARWTGPVLVAWIADEYNQKISLRTAHYLFKLVS